jgi:uncharacterized protein (TIGR00369 family)
MTASPQMIQLPAFALDPAQSGLELARRWVETVWPGGFVNRLAARPVEAAEGLMRVECDIDPGHSNFVGLVHGGVTAALVDIVGGGAAMTLLKPGEFLLSTDLSMRFLNAAPIGCGLRRPAQGGGRGHGLDARGPDHRPRLRRHCYPRPASGRLNRPEA